MLNNKGITTVEVLLCFILITIISTSLFSTVSMFNEKRIEESYKSKILVYNNTLTRIIQKDFIYYGISSANIEETTDNGAKIYTVNCILNNGDRRTLRVRQRFTRSNLHLEAENAKYDDEFMIEYGTPEKMTKYPIPELGEVNGKYDDELKTFVPCSNGEKRESDELRKQRESDPNSVSQEAIPCKILKDLEINNIIINISNELSSENVGNRILNIYIGFYHPELGNRYAINIVSPINYPTIMSSENGKFNFNIITE